MPRALRAWPRGHYVFLGLAVVGVIWFPAASLFVHGMPLVFLRATEGNLRRWPKLIMFWGVVVLLINFLAGLTFITPSRAVEKAGTMGEIWFAATFFSNLLLSPTLVLSRLRDLRSAPARDTREES